MSNADESTDAVAILRFFYCGTGDTILIESSNDARGLIDCNLTRSSGAYRRVRRFIQERDIRKLKFVCLSHPDLDHYRGMRDLLFECFFDVETGIARFEQFWDAGADIVLFEAFARRAGAKLWATELGKLYDFLEPLVLKDHIEYIGLQAGHGPDIGFGDFFFVALTPRANRVKRFNQYKVRTVLQGSRESLQGPIAQANELSVILVMMHRSLPINILFGADATAAVWDEALDTWERLCDKVFPRRSRFFDVVKVSSHGGIGAMNSRLYHDYCRPGITIAVLSVGPHDPIHPHPDVLQALKEQNITVCATCWPTEETGSADGGNLLLTGAPALSADDFPELAGYDCGDIEICISRVCPDKVRVSVSPDKSILRL